MVFADGFLIPELDVASSVCQPRRVCPDGSVATRRRVEGSVDRFAAMVQLLARPSTVAGRASLNFEDGSIVAFAVRM